MAEGFQLLFQAADGPVVRTFDQDRVVIGRSMVCGVVLDSPQLSRKHAEILRDGNGWMIHDLGSRHGVAVNGKVVSDQRLAHGDRITLSPEAADPTILDFRLPQADRVASDVRLSDDSGTTSVVASIDLPKLAKTLSSSGMQRRAAIVAEVVGVALHQQAAASPDALAFEGSPQLPALSLFKSAGEVLLANETLEEMLQEMANLIGEHLPGRRVAVCMSDPDSSELLPRCFNDAPRDKSADRSSAAADHPRPFPISRSILQEAVRVRRALLVACAPEDPRFRTAVSVHRMGIRSAICVPLYHAGRIEGAIYVDSQFETGPFSGADLEVLTVLGLMVAAGIAQMSLRGDIARERTIRGRLARYNSPQVVEQIMRLGPLTDDEMLADEYDVSVLFADLGGFTALAERWAAAEVVRVLNLIFERWTADVFARDGTLDKYIGDAVMAVFGAPLRQTDHAARAVATALAMQRSLEEFNHARQPELPLTVRIGVNSGRVIAGDIGSPQHRAYTVIGDVVNIASRLETSVAQPGQIVIGPATFEQVSSLYACEPLGPIQLRGKRHAIEAYRLIEAKSEPESGAYTTQSLK